MASSAPQVSDSENLAGLMHPIMLRRGIQPKDVDEKRRHQVVPGKAEFFCVQCNYTWHSHFSWIRFDLFDQRITYRWSMKCKHCLTLSKPTFSVMETEKLIEKAMCQYKGEVYRNPYARNGGGGGFYEYIEPHLAKLCEKCGWGKTECWVAYRTNH